MTPTLKLYYSPGACSRVVLTALEHIGVPYDDEMVNIHEKEHLTDYYRGVNPRGKVPALYIGDRLLTENGAIQIWLDRTFPEAKLLPHSDDSVVEAQYLSDIFWFSSVWHPSVRANRAPSRWTIGDEEDVRARGKQLFAPLIGYADQRLAGGEWYYGDDWTIIDAYLYWCYTTAANGDYALDGLDNIARHRQAMEARPALQAALAREQAGKNRRAG